MSSASLKSALGLANDRQMLCARVKKIIVERLELPIPPEWITDDQPLFGRGLELDSLDVLELSMAVDSEFDVTVYDDNVALFGSVSIFVDHLVGQGQADPATEIRTVSGQTGQRTNSNGALSDDALDMNPGSGPGPAGRQSPLRELFPASTTFIEIQAAAVAWDFGDTAGEYDAIRQDAARIDLSSAGILDVTGPDAYDLLQSALARDVQFITPEQSLASLVLDAAGHPVDLVTAYLLDDGFRLETAFGRGPATAAHLEALRASSGAQARIEDASDTVTIILVEGPAAPTVLKSTIDPDLGALPLGGVMHVEVQGEDITVSRTGFTGEFGYKLFTLVERAAAVWDALGELRPAGLGAFETAMLEVRQPLLHREVAPGASALECGYNWLIDITKESFHGRDAVVREFESGRRPAVIGWVSDSVAEPPARGAEVTIGGEVIGSVVHAVFSPGRKEVVGIARIRPELVAPGLDLTVSCQAASCQAAQLAAKTVPAPYVVPTSWARREGADAPVPGVGA
jgi:aminomethyltransferase